MKQPDFTATLLVDQTPKETSSAILNVRGWWSENIEGSTDTLHDEFFYHYKDLHLCKMKMIELVPGHRVVWLVQDNYFQFTKDDSEWKGTKIVFDISQNGNRTEITFTHEGLVPQYECYEICREAWTHYIKDSLRNLITTGKGEPAVKENEGYDTKFVEKWKLERIPKPDYTTSLLVDQTPAEIFNAINNVTAWWSTKFEGHTDKLNDSFTVRFGEIYITSKVTELIPAKKIVWLVTDCNKPWLKNTKEWVGTAMTWEITDKEKKTEIRFTHVGLVPEVECFGACSNAWGQYIRQSLWSLITTGKGQPTAIEARVENA